MPIAFGPDEYVATVRQESGAFTDGYALCVLGVTAQGSGDPLGQIAAVIYGAWRDNILPLQATDTILTRVDVLNETLFGSAIGSAAGGATASMLASNSSILVSKASNIRGRRGRGRMYIPNSCDEEAVYSNGELETGFRTQWQAAVRAFQLDLVDGNVLLSVPQGDNPGDKSPPLSPWPLVTALLVDAKIGTQRRRMRR